MAQNDLLKRSERLQVHSLINRLEAPIIDRTGFKDTASILLIRRYKRIIRVLVRHNSNR